MSEKTDKVPCLSVRQPWAWLIVHGFKPVENRNWRPYAGFETNPASRRILIHAAKTFDSDGYDWLRSEMRCLHRVIPREETFRRQAIAGSVTIEEISPGKHWKEWKGGENQPWVDKDAKYHWFLGKPIAFKQELRMRGQQSIFWIPKDILKRNGLLKPQPPQGREFREAAQPYRSFAQFNKGQ